MVKRQICRPNPIFLSLRADFDVPIQDQRYLYVYRLCKKELKDLMENVTKPAQREIETLVAPIIQDIGAKIGIGRDLDLTELKLLHLTCAFEHAIFKDSPWCTLFDENDLKRMEYLADLNYLAKNFGDVYNRNASCELMRNLLETIDFSIKNPRSRTASLYFSHSGMTKPHSCLV